ncbi:MAG: hypothetical protein KGI41_03460 [Patescibacteria group bacterium]|nr:hypothetical protein [Patescibacteria group bacterium]MDE1966268.1 hypothetical protein [Patescibacteria group bacterium]
MAKPEGPEKPIPLGEARLKKEERERRKSLGVSSDDSFIYPERRRTMTPEEALALSRELIARLSDESALVREVEAYERRRAPGISALADGTNMRAFTRKSLAGQREQSAYSSMKHLLGVFEEYKRNPLHYYPTILLASAEEIVRRLDVKPKGPEDGEA